MSLFKHGLVTFRMRNNQTELPSKIKPHRSSCSSVKTANIFSTSIHWCIYFPFSPSKHTEHCLCALNHILLNFFPLLAYIVWGKNIRISFVRVFQSVWYDMLWQIRVWWHGLNIILTNVIRLALSHEVAVKLKRMDDPANNQSLLLTNVWTVVNWIKPTSAYCFASFSLPWYL